MNTETKPLKRKGAISDVSKMFSVNGTRKQHIRRYKQINFIGLQNNRIFYNTPLVTFMKLLEIVSKVPAGARSGDILCTSFCFPA
jgi:hypothetical protein